MKRELAFALEAQSQLTESLGRTRSSKPTPQENGSLDQSPEIRVSVSKCTALNVYQRNKRLKKSVENGGSVNKEDTKGDSVNKEDTKGETVTKEAVEVPRRFTRSLLKEPGGEDVETRANEEKMVSKVDKDNDELETKVPKEIKLTGRPTNVKELLETGLLEGYPVYYSRCEKKVVFVIVSFVSLYCI